FGAVTIATNMAGRGVDIKLGGEFDPTNLAEIKRVISKDVPNVYTLSDVEMYQSLMTVLGKRSGVYDVEKIIAANPIDYPVLLREEFIKKAELSEAVMQSKSLNEWGLLEYALGKVGISGGLFKKLNDF